jgi:hypothetical protein
MAEMLAELKRIQTDRDAIRKKMTAEGAKKWDAENKKISGLIIKLESLNKQIQGEFVETGKYPTGKIPVFSLEYIEKRVGEFEEELKGTFTLQRFKELRKEMAEMLAELKRIQADRDAIRKKMTAEGAKKWDAENEKISGLIIKLESLNKQIQGEFVGTGKYPINSRIDMTEGREGVTYTSTALVEAAKANRLDIVKYLVENGADVNARDYKRVVYPGAIAVEHSAIDYARQNDNQEMIKVLQEKGALPAAQIKKVNPLIFKPESHDMPADKPSPDEGGNWA